MVVNKIKTLSSKLKFFILFRGTVIQAFDYEMQLSDRVMFIY